MVLAAADLAAAALALVEVGAGAEVGMAAVVVLAVAALAAALALVAVGAGVAVVMAVGDRDPSPQRNGLRSEMLRSPFAAPEFNSQPITCQKSGNAIITTMKMIMTTGKPSRRKSRK